MELSLEEWNTLGTSKVFFEKIETRMGNRSLEQNRIGREGCVATLVEANDPMMFKLGTNFSNFVVDCTRKDR